MMQELDGAMWEPSPKQSSGRVWKILAIVLMIVATVAIWKLFSNTDPVDNSWKQELEELRKEDAKDKERLSQLEGHRRVMEASIARLITQNEALSQKLDNVKRSYHEKRTDISALPDDEQLRLFAAWLSEIDSLRD